MLKMMGGTPPPPNPPSAPATPRSTKPPPGRFPEHAPRHPRTETPRPGASGRGSPGRAGGQHDKQLGPQRCQSLDLGANHGDVAPQQDFDGLARAGAGVADGEQIADPGQPQPEPLGVADEQQPVQGGRPVPAAVTVGAPRAGSRPFPS